MSELLLLIPANSIDHSINLQYQIMHMKKVSSLIVGNLRTNVGPYFGPRFILGGRLRSNSS